ncbi:hypothetical protein QBC40DRAFT_288588 [Triangularia verruculosa]|uniref:Uncharacterized protein n=1 Tax=Triangularia verruculosa TaxID=2587418 RepID=A0AAN7ANX3_9PEZI|nr:hypothetical protein QBC40DRAFT_288588 [Triangularia verruculosa]
MSVADPWYISSCLKLGKSFSFIKQRLTSTSSPVYNHSISIQVLQQQSNTFIMSERAAQSPPPEEQSGRQLNDPPASGKGTDDATNKEQTNKTGLENLSSNPKGPMDDEVTKKFAKNTKMGDSQ